MTTTPARRTNPCEGRPAAGRVLVALTTVVTVMVVGLLSLFAVPASATTFTGAQNGVGVIHITAGQRVGAHESILAGQHRQRAPCYDQTVVGCGVGAESESSTLSDLAAACGGQSFTPTTQVRLADGTSIPIDQVKVGDKVLASDPKTGQTQAEPVTALWVNHDTDLLDLTVSTASGNTIVDTTQHHLFYDLTTHNWVQAENLHSDDRLYTADGQLATLIGTAIVPGAADMWDLTVANDHDFYIDTLTTAVLVHNCPSADSWPSVEHGDQLPQSGDFPYKPPKGGNGLPVRLPGGQGFVDAEGNEWQWARPNVQHGGPHWDVQLKNGGYVNVFPDGTTR